MHDTTSPAILIFDLETDRDSGALLQIGALRSDNGARYESPILHDDTARTAAIAALEALAADVQYLMGHNILAHDLPVLHQYAPASPLHDLPVIDTLRLSPLAFPQNPYHRLLKDYKIVRTGKNSPLADCEACWRLFHDQSAAFSKLRQEAPETFALYRQLFGALPYHENDTLQLAKAHTLPPADLPDAITRLLQDEDGLRVCQMQLTALLQQTLPDNSTHIPLAYTLSWLKVSGGNSVLAPWVRQQFPASAQYIDALRNHDCGDPACHYCQTTHNPRHQLKRYFGFDRFRAIEHIEGGQEAIVRAGMAGENVLTVLATGGGKSICFQLPALNRYHRNGGLTIVICPLQSLMMDQVKNLQDNGISGVDTLNGMRSITERADILDRIALGDIGILFVAPEQFRNTSFLTAIKQRQINGFVFDEAHCLSKWGHDFRPDYRYAAKYIKEHHSSNLPAISCFTATAKPDVLDEIRTHFAETLGITFHEFLGGHERDNLAYEVLQTAHGEKKHRIHELLQRELGHQDGGAVVFVARRKSAETISEYLKQQNWACAHYHAGLGANEKADIQQRFIDGELRVIVATNAFGMGVDKKDVRAVIHAEIPGSLENYLQEAGRAGRDQQHAHCILLYDPHDIDTQFTLNKHNQLERRDLQHIWKKLRNMDNSHRDGHNLIVTSGELLRGSSGYMSFDDDDRAADTKTKTALAWLERAELLARSENQTRIYPSRSGKLTLEQALAKIRHDSGLSQRKQDLYSTVAEIVYRAEDDKPLGTDELIKQTGATYTEIHGILKALEALDILTNDTRITVILRVGISDHAGVRLERLLRREQALWQKLQELVPDAALGEWQRLPLSPLCQQLKDTLDGDDHEHNKTGKTDAPVPADLKKLLFSLAADKDAINHSGGSLDLRDMGNDLLQLRFKNPKDDWDDLITRSELRRTLCTHIVPYLIQKAGKVRSKDALAETSYGELLEQFNKNQNTAAIPAEKREALLNQALLYLHKQDVIRLNHGMTILRHAMTIHLNETNLHKDYLKNDFTQLARYYISKRLQIHAMREYAVKALEKITLGLELVKDYFHDKESDFYNKWFKGREAELKEDISPATLKKITGALNPVQHAIVTDKSDHNHLILAGPGSGKTRVIVHRVAWLVRARHSDPAGIIVLAYNRHAAREIKKRLYDLIGGIAAAITVLTYDGMAMRLLGVRITGKEEIAKDQFLAWCEEAAAMLNHSSDNDADIDDARDKLLAGFRYILVDEYQDISEPHYNLVSALAGRSRQDDNDKLTLLAVGDDDQNIYSWNGSSSNTWIERFCNDYHVAHPDYLTQNYRSSAHIIAAANAVIATLPDRLKQNQPITINDERRDDPPGGDWSEKDPARQGKVRIIRLPDGSNHNRQTQAIWAEIQRLREKDPAIEWKNIAILVRNNDQLKTLQTLCENQKIPYSVSCYKNSQTALHKLRQIVRLKEAIIACKEPLAARDIKTLLEQQQTDSRWREYLNTLFQDFCDEHGEYLSHDTTEDNSPAQYQPDYLKKWLDDYLIELKKLRSSGIYLGTIHSAKGLEFKHVFLPDSGWTNNAEECRLYYVGMTRAIETLTLIQSDPKHPFIAALPEENTDKTEQHFAEDITLHTEYRTLLWGEMDLGFAAADEHIKKDSPDTPQLQNIHEKLRAIASLDVGTPLQVRRRYDIWEFLHDGIVVARTSKGTKETMPQGNFQAVVAELVVRYKTEEGEQYRYRYPEEIEKWTVVVPQLIIPGTPQHPRHQPTT
ncbi:RecQ family ATP-dependent DNA helicase [uncultured Cardiobacterium sp.]|uniref:RecQ family ATP-dependent DNA helicase n=1 Tax=uncultured Cardiobacterium sp. TaxID=417619 RepID=UPI002622E04E|nr:RecQ family ATP-dependent DNA helicase [uncultured Cardiobacterium sp.]